MVSTARWMALIPKRAGRFGTESSTLRIELSTPMWPTVHRQGFAGAALGARALAAGAASLGVASSRITLSELSRERMTRTFAPESATDATRAVFATASASTPVTSRRSTVTAVSPCARPTSVKPRA